jgi:hypothetical protein
VAAGPRKMTEIHTFMHSRDARVWSAGVSTGSNNASRTSVKVQFVDFLTLRNGSTAPFVKKFVAEPAPKRSFSAAPRVRPFGMAVRR